MFKLLFILVLKKSLTDSWTFFKSHVVAISLIVLPIVVPIEIFTAFYQYYFTSDEYVFYEQIIPMGIGLVAYPIYAVGVIFYISSKISGVDVDTKALWRLGVKFWLPYIVLTTFVGVAVLFGFILLVIPGVIFAIRYSFSEFDLLLNQRKLLEAMRNSWEITKDYMWVIFGGFVVITIALYVPYYLVSSLFDKSSISYWILDSASNIVYSILGILYTIFAFRVYEFARLQHNQSLNQDAP